MRKKGTYQKGQILGVMEGRTKEGWGERKIESWTKKYSLKLQSKHRVRRKGKMTR